MKYKYMIGADPELFLIDGNGAFRSAHNVIPGSKHEPHEVLSGAIQPDGVAAEFNIHPAETAQQFTENIRDVLAELQSRVEAKGLSLLVTPTAHFDKKYFKKLPARAKALGCEPDYNVYTESVNPAPHTKEPFRTGAGHIHVGWTQGQSTNDSAHLFDCRQAVLQLDSVLYPLSLLWDNDEKRRTLYGKIGSYRPKHYGVEYRPLSNAWVADPDLHIWVFEATKAAMDSLDQGVCLWNDYFQQDIIGTIKKETQPSRTALLEYHDYLVETHGIPKMPDPYVRIHQ